MKKCNVLVCSHYGHNSPQCDLCKWCNIKKNEKNIEDQRIHYVQHASDEYNREKEIIRCKKRR